ncbi:MAG TPA: FtsX-like permease family protein, partial [Candidatus Saccharimonadales bacterium]|nr:FtsX-like permease family protein [Candidatus Saccharimonadales bacterium]
LQGRIEQKEGKGMRVVGVVENFRRGGELMDDGPYMLMPAILDNADTSNTPTGLESILIRVAPGTTAAFEEPLMKSLQAVAHGWSFQIVHMETARRDRIRSRLIPLGSVGLIAAFLLLMVVLGLTGVMWQNVTRRTREFGLRRAVGAHRTRIHSQIVGEVAVTAGLGILAGTLVAAQTPLIGAFSFVPFSEVLSALAAAAALMLVLAAVCGLYPGWSATKIHPAEALHYE